MSGRDFTSLRQNNSIHDFSYRNHEYFHSFSIPTTHVALAASSYNELFYHFFYLDLKGTKSIVLNTQRTKRMPNDIDKIFLSSEIEPSPQNISNADLTDVLVRLKDGKEYTATFFTFDNISKTVVRHKKNGKHLYGKYF